MVCGWFQLFHSKLWSVHPDLLCDDLDYPPGHALESLHFCRWKTQALSSSPQAVIQLALNRATEEVKDIQPATADANKAEIKPNVSSNTEVCLWQGFNQLLLGNRFLGLDKIKLDKRSWITFAKSKLSIATVRKKPTEWSWWKPILPPYQAMSNMRRF